MDQIQTSTPSQCSHRRSLMGSSTLLPAVYLMLFAAWESSALWSGSDCIASKRLCLQGYIYGQWTTRFSPHSLYLLSSSLYAIMAPSPPPTSPYKRIITYSSRHRKIATPSRHHKTSSRVQGDNLPSGALEDVVDSSNDAVATASKNSLVIAPVRTLLTF